MASHEIDYEVLEEGVQFVEITLDPAETVIAEAGAMVYMEDGIAWQAKMGDGSNMDKGLVGKLFSAGNVGSMLFGGEGLFVTTLSGSGTVLLQSTPASRMSAALLKNFRSQGTSGSKPIGNLGDLINRL
jgi:uncharacterized protein (AIM24 family)